MPTIMESALFLWCIGSAQFLVFHCFCGIMVLRSAQSIYGLFVICLVSISFFACLLTHTNHSHAKPQTTDFSELFSLKCIYVKYENAILLLIDCFFRT